ncbi:MAG: hypothetical protein ACREL5_00855 [Gemmatimonadales bacterium]
MRLSALPIAVALVGCYPTTTRPAFPPVPAAQIIEIELPVADATSALAVMLDQDSIPVRRTEPKDGWLETGWFDTGTLQPTNRRPIGDSVVRVRAWIDPSRPVESKPNYSNVTIETVYRPMVDPSRPERDLEEQVPANNPVSGRIVLIMAQLARTYGGVDTTARADSGSAKKPARDTTVTRPAAGSVVKKPGADSATKKPAADSVVTKPVIDSAKKKPAADSVVTKPVIDSAKKKPRPDTLVIRLPSVSVSGTPPVARYAGRVRGPGRVARAGRGNFSG